MFIDDISSILHIVKLIDRNNILQKQNKFEFKAIAKRFWMLMQNENAEMYLISNFKSLNSCFHSISVVQVIYSGKAVTCGQNLPIAEAKETPEVKYEAADNELYTLVMIGELCINV